MIEIDRQQEQMLAGKHPIRRSFRCSERLDRGYGLPADIFGSDNRADQVFPGSAISRAMRRRCANEINVRRSIPAYARHVRDRSLLGASLLTTGREQEHREAHGEDHAHQHILRPRPADASPPSSRIVPRAMPFGRPTISNPQGVPHPARAC